MNLENKDALYYSDLMYVVKSLAGFKQLEDKETEERIAKRQEDIVVERENGMFRYLNELSVFQQELFGIVGGISKKAGVAFRGLEEVSKYPELVNEVLTDLENKINELNNANSLENNGPVLTKKLNISNQ